MKGVVSKILHANLYTKVLEERNTGKTKSPRTLPSYMQEDVYHGIGVEMYYKTKMEIYLFVGSETAELQLKLLEKIIGLTKVGKEWVQNKISEQGLTF